MKRKNGATKRDQSARFIEAAKDVGADQKDFERAFKKIVKPKKSGRNRQKDASS